MVHINSSCGGFSRSVLIAFSASNGVSTFVCLLATILVCILKLYKIMVYRLALYQVLAALVYGANYTLQVIFIDSPQPFSDVYNRLCEAFGAAAMYLEWVKLLFTVWVTVHLFCFVVFYKNLKKLEAVYVSTSLLIPAVIAAVPFATHTYGLSGSWCWIEEWKNNCTNDTVRVGVIEEFTLWYGPSMLSLIAASLAMLLMLIVLLYRVRVHKAVEYSANWRAFKQILPLAAYPIIFFLFLLPPFIYRVLVAGRINQLGTAALTAIAVVFSGKDFLAGVTLIIHIALIRLSRRAVAYPTKYGSFEAATVRKGTENEDKDYTYFNVPRSINTNAKE